MASKPRPAPGVPEPDINDPGETLTEAEAEDAAEQNAYLTSHGDIGLVTSAEHAIPLLKGKISQLHQLIHNIASAAEVPAQAIEALVAEVTFLVGVVRSKL